MGITAHFAQQRGFYKIHALDGVSGARSAMMMYGGALLWLVSIGFAFLWALYSLLGIGALLSQFFRPVRRIVTQLFHSFRKNLGPVRRIFTQLFLPLRKIIGWPRIRKPDISQDPKINVPAEHAPKVLEERHPDIPSKGGNPHRNSDRRKRPRVLEDILHLESHDDVDHAPWELALHSMGMRGRISMVQRFFFAMVAPFLAQWIFWSGFVRLAQDSYCPPPVWQMTGIWTIFSGLGLFFGAAP
jgi:hypothetical protein